MISQIGLFKFFPIVFGVQWYVCVCVCAVDIPSTGHALSRVVFIAVVVLSLVKDLLFPSTTELCETVCSAARNMFPH
jgi:uncharacterized membrane protein YgaE (UPF0421/DUF939 family)